MKRILVVRFGSLGDVILSSAAVLNLKISFPTSRITYLTKARFAPLVERFDGVDDIVVLPERTGAWGLVKLLLDIDARSFDAVVDLHGNPRSWLARQLISATHKTVYPKRRLERAAAVRRKVFADSWPHTIDLYNMAVRDIGGRTPSVRPVLPSMGNVRLSPVAANFFERHKEVVVVAPGAAHPTKQWPIERFRSVAEELNHGQAAGVIWAVTSGDKGKAPKSDEIAAEHLLELVDCPLTQLAGILQRSTITIANDSGVAHLSSAVGTPVLAIFGPTHQSLGFAPRGLFDRVIEVDEYCRPCSLHGATPCVREERFCFTRIQPFQVAAAAGDVIHQSAGSAPALFVDRDGTVMADKDYLSDPDQVALIPGSAEALRCAKAAGFRIVIVSNQSGVARGLFGTEAVERVNARLFEVLHREGVWVDDVLYCPHHPLGSVEQYAVDCPCRKPAAGMPERAASRIGIDLRRSWVVGDKADDINMARLLGARGVLVRTGYGSVEEPLVKGMGLGRRGLVADNLAAAVQMIAREGAE